MCCVILLQCRADLVIQKKLIRHNFFQIYSSAFDWNSEIVPWYAKVEAITRAQKKKKNIKENFKWSLHDFCFTV